jgi:hypothetical protein|tara:strand:- start:376 stop:738 length:363 start_codon:yes stop_codon:yes gene_type:complete
MGEKKRYGLSNKERKLRDEVEELYKEVGPESHSRPTLTRTEIRRMLDPVDKKGIEEALQDIDDEVASKSGLIRQGATSVRLSGERSKLKRKLKKLYGKGSFVAAENAKMIQPRKAKYKKK